MARQVGRVEAEVAKLRPMLDPGEPAQPQVSAESIRAILDARRRREKLFGPGLFADAAWDILLELYAAKLADERVTVGYLSNAAGVPATTALTRIKHLQRAGLIVRIPDPVDRRRMFAELSRHGAAIIARFFEDGAAPLLGI